MANKDNVHEIKCPIKVYNVILVFEKLVSHNQLHATLSKILKKYVRNKIIQRNYLGVEQRCNEEEGAIKS